MCAGNLLVNTNLDELCSWILLINTYDINTILDYFRLYYILYYILYLYSIIAYFRSTYTLLFITCNVHSIINIILTSYIFRINDHP